MLVRSSEVAYEDGESREYALALQNVAANPDTYERVGFLVVNRADRCFRNAPVVLLLIV
jgi:hypothetical protein